MSGRIIFAAPVPEDTPARTARGRKYMARAKRASEGGTRPTILGLCAVLLAAGHVPLAAAAIAAAPMAAAPAHARAGDAERRALGLRLARLLNGEEATLAAMTRVLTDSLPDAVLRDPGIRAAEDVRPGAVKAIVAAVVPVMIGHMRRELPLLWPRLGDFYADNLSEADLRAALAFYAGPTGTRIVALMHEGMDFNAMLKDIVLSGDYAASANRYRSASKSGATSTLHRLSREELAEAARFGRTPEGRKLIALSPKLDVVVSEWANAPDPRLDAALQKVMAAKVAELSGKERP